MASSLRLSGRRAVRWGPLDGAGVGRTGRRVYSHDPPNPLGDLLPVDLPPDVIRILSFHGPVDVWVGDEGALARDRAAVAPFEDLVYVFVRRGSPLEQALLSSCAAQLQARHPDGKYSLRLAGRAHAGQPLIRHPMRASIEPWMPEGAHVTTLVAAPFTAERIELTRDEAGQKVHYFGATPSGKARPSRALVLARALFGGFAGVFGAVAFLAPWIWLGAQGPEYHLRGVALAMSVVGGLCLIGGARLMASSYGFLRWREGRARPADALVLIEALMSPATAHTTAIAMLGVGVVLAALVGTFWDARIMMIALLANGAWLMGPAWALHLSHRRPERDD